MQLKNKLSYKEKQQLDSLPNEINQLELKQAEIQGILSDKEFYRKSPEEIQECNKKMMTVEVELLKKLALWEELEQRNNQMK